MNKEIKDEWIAALRSGNYKQGRSFLRSGSNEYCCAGVLCDILIKRGDGEWKLDFESNNYKYDRSSFSLTHETLERVGIHNLVQDLMCKTQEGEHSIYHMNDIMKLNFNQIADIIEKEF